MGVDGIFGRKRVNFWMYIKKLKIVNFRNIKNLELELNKNVNIFIGKNAQGKTSILESIYVLALTKSMKNAFDSNLINKDSEFSRLKCTLGIENRFKDMEVILESNKKTLKVDGKEESKVFNYVSLMNVIIFSPDDLDIVKKSPSYRRNLLNIELCQLFSDYTRVLNEYNKLLKIRNEYLKKDNFDEIYFDILTDRLIDRAIVIMKYRDNFIKSINLGIDDIYYRIMKVRGLSVCYEANLGSFDKGVIKKLYLDNFESERAKKLTLFGPHRDDFSFYLGDDDLKLFGSQGQQRVSILSFKLAEIKLFKEVNKSYPIVLLDDIFSELDLEKRKNFLKFIKSNIQFIVTTTDINNISSKVLDKASVYRIKDGNLMNRSVLK